MGFAKFDDYDGMGLAELVSRDEVTPTELAEEAIRRIEGHNPALNAVIFKMYDEARASAARMSSLPAGRQSGTDRPVRRRVVWLPLTVEPRMRSNAGV